MHYVAALCFVVGCVFFFAFGGELCVSEKSFGKVRTMHVFQCLLYLLLVFWFVPEEELTLLLLFIGSACGVYGF